MRVYLEKALLLEQQGNGIIIITTNIIIGAVIFNIASTSKLSTRLLQQSLETLLDVTKVFERSTQTDKEIFREESFIQLVSILMQRLQTVLKQLLSISLKKGLVSYLT